MEEEHPIGRKAFQEKEQENLAMEDFGFREMQEIQRQLQEKYKDKWNPLSPEQGKDQLMWMMIEVGEAADIMKKEGVRKIMEEMVDIMMYYNDVLLSYDISIEEFRDTYLKKHQRNMKRW